MIVSPLLLELGVHPLVAASTSSLMVRPCSRCLQRLPQRDPSNRVPVLVVARYACVL